MALLKCTPWYSIHRDPCRKQVRYFVIKIMWPPCLFQSPLSCPRIYLGKFNVSSIKLILKLQNKIYFIYKCHYVKWLGINICLRLPKTGTNMLHWLGQVLWVHQSKMEMFRSKMAERRPSWIGKIWSFRLCFWLQDTPEASVLHNEWFLASCDPRWPPRWPSCQKSSLCDNSKSTCPIALKLYMGHR